MPLPDFGLMSNLSIGSDEDIKRKKFVPVNPNPTASTGYQDPASNIINTVGRYGGEGNVGGQNPATQSIGQLLSSLLKRPDEKEY